MENKRLSKEILERLSEYYTEIYQDPYVMILCSKFEIGVTIYEKLYYIKNITKSDIRLVGDLLVISNRAENIDEITLNYLCDNLDSIKEYSPKKESIINQKLPFKLIFKRIAEYARFGLKDAVLYSIVLLKRDETLLIRLPYELPYTLKNVELLFKNYLYRSLGNNIKVTDRLDDIHGRLLIIELNLEARPIGEMIAIVDTLVDDIRRLNNLDL